MRKIRNWRESIFAHSPRNNYVLGMIYDNPDIFTAKPDRPLCRNPI